MRIGRAGSNGSQEQVTGLAPGTLANNSNKRSGGYGSESFESAGKQTKNQ
jgi:hypothetical protein